jgi:hypothetical protein
MKKIKLNLDKSDARSLLFLLDKIHFTKKSKSVKMVETLLSEQLEMINK